MIFHDRRVVCPLQRAIGSGLEEHLSLTRISEAGRVATSEISEQWQPLCPSLSSSKTMAIAQSKEPQEEVFVRHTQDDLRPCSSHPFLKVQKSVLHVYYKRSICPAWTLTTVVMRVTNCLVTVVVTVAVMVVSWNNNDGSTGGNGNSSKRNCNSGSNHSSDWLHGSLRLSFLLRNTRIIIPSENCDKKPDRRHTQSPVQHLAHRKPQ